MHASVYDFGANIKSPRPLEAASVSSGLLLRGHWMCVLQPKDPEKDTDQVMSTLPWSFSVFLHLVPD